MERKFERVRTFDLSGLDVQTRMRVGEEKCPDGAAESDSIARPSVAHSRSGDLMIVPLVGNTVPGYLACSGGEQVGRERLADGQPPLFFS